MNVLHRAAALVLVAAGASACAARGFTPPVGPVQPFPDAAQVWEQVTTRCRDAQRYVAQVRVQGWVNARDQRIARTLSGAVTRTDDIVLELQMLGTTVFQMGGVAGHSTFALLTERRVLRADTRDIVEALTGLRWGGRELLDVLTGCVATSGAAVTGTRTGPWVSLTVSPSVTAWLRERDGAWRIHAARIAEWLVEYRAVDGGWPSDVRVTSTGATPLDLQFTLSQVKVNIDLPPGMFVLTVPDHFIPMTLDDLRSIGPLRDGPVKDGGS